MGGGGNECEWGLTDESCEVVDEFLGYFGVVCWFGGGGSEGGGGGEEGGEDDGGFEFDEIVARVEESTSWARVSNVAIRESARLT